MTVNFPVLFPTTPFQATFPTTPFGIIFPTVDFFTDFIGVAATPTVVIDDVTGEIVVDDSTGATVIDDTGHGVSFLSPSASRVDVLATIALTSPGDTVIVPAGVESWAGGITISGITLQGPGRNAASPVNISAGLVTLTKHATHNTKFAGFRFTGTDMHLVVDGDSADKPFIVDDCYLFNNGSAMVLITVNGGLVSRINFEAIPAHGADTIRLVLNSANGLLSWGNPTTMGVEDASGVANTYFEDCTWDGFLEISMDVDDGARVVVRNCVFTDSSITVHGGGSGTSGNDSSIVGGRHLEIYDCSFVRVSNLLPINKWVWWRGSSGVFANNVLAKADSPDGFSFPNKTELRLSVGCPGPYPLTFQVGQSAAIADATPDRPLLIFGNTGAGAVDTNFIGITENPLSACGNPEDFIQLGRDYQLSNTWGWVAYPYPHPLRG